MNFNEIYKVKMSIQSITSTITRLNKELADITHKMSLEQKKTAAITSKILQIQNSISKSTPASTLKSKLSEISRKEPQSLIRLCTKPVTIRKDKRNRDLIIKQHWIAASE